MNYKLMVAHRLLNIGKSQKWLCEQVTERTGLYLDSSYLSKISEGKLSGKKVVPVINEILGIDEAAMQALGDCRPGEAVSDNAVSEKTGD